MRWLKVLFCAVFFAVAFVVSTSFTIRLLLQDESTIACPDLTGLDVEEAKALGRQKGLSVLIVKYERRKDVPYNRVLVQKPDAAMAVKGGRTVSVVVSDGPKPSAIPSFVGLSLEEAQGVLQQQAVNLKKVIYVPSDNLGKVVAQEPGPGENILGDEGMVLIVGGREKRFFLMPDITGGDYVAAAEEMEKKQIKYLFVAAGTRQSNGTKKVIIKSSVAPQTIFGQDEILELQITGGG